MRRFIVLTALLVPLALPAAFCVRQDRPLDPGPLRIESRTVGVIAGEMRFLRLRGAIELAADHAAFGGFSGLAIQGSRLLAVTDTGWMLEADLVESSDGLSLHRAGFRPLLDTDGQTFSKSGGDAEGLALRDGALWISFERDHRIVRYTGDRPATTIRDNDFERMSSNSGLEALAALPGGGLLAIAEGDVAGGFPVYVANENDRLFIGRLPRTSRHDVTGADIGPDGRLYLVLRDYIPLVGLSIRIQRYHLTADGLPDPATREDLAVFDESSGIDNMEGIAVWTDATGRARLTLISDDNFNPLQRTLILDFEIIGAKG